MPALSARTDAAVSIEFVKKGQVTIPKRVRDDYGITEGQKGSLIELDGGFLILPRQSKIGPLLDTLREGLGTSDMSLEEMVAELRRIRETSDYESQA